MERDHCRRDGEVVEGGDGPREYRANTTRREDVYDGEEAIRRGGVGEESVHGSAVAESDDGRVVFDEGQGMVGDFNASLARAFHKQRRIGDDMVA